jgi:hypothetical protein
VEISAAFPHRPFPRRLGNLAQCFIASVLLVAYAAQANATGLSTDYLILEKPVAHDRCLQIGNDVAKAAGLSVQGQSNVAVSANDSGTGIYQIVCVNPTVVFFAAAAEKNFDQVKPALAALRTNFQSKAAAP